jgi:hypothetical protein
MRTAKEPPREPPDDAPVAIRWQFPKSRPMSKFATDFTEVKNHSEIKQVAEGMSV